MIVWGVHWEYDSTTGNNIPAPKGGRYNPSTDTWTPTTTVGAPVIGGTNKAIWTGKEMIVWGGDYFRFPGVGARYNPTTDTWVPMSTLGAPNGRSDQTVVWTGTEMIVWGGGAQDDIQASGVYFFNTGARYNPVKDAWTATTTVNAPSPRDRHTAIWTGTEMVVYGGHFCDWDDGDDCVFLSYTLNTGGRYDPVTDSWIATNAGAAPGPTTFDSSVWTGSEMIVWGGLDHFDGGRVNTGGRYDPITDSWARTSILGAPSARSSHTAVW